MFSIYDDIFDELKEKQYEEVQIKPTMIHREWAWFHLLEDVQSFFHRNLVRIHRMQGGVRRDYCVVDRHVLADSN